MSPESLPGEEKSVSKPVTDVEAAPKAGVEREDAQPDPILTPAVPEQQQPVATRKGMWSEGTGDTSGYSRIVRATDWPAPMVRSMSRNVSPSPSGKR